ncbi:MAG TPA: TonB-dependent receptor [Thermoanaerobaculia bacterium]|nr:TonB-dependent receptor [Thermoanaerobaculia bacterium]
MSVSRRLSLFVVLSLFVLAPAAIAQVTTGNLGGEVTAGGDGSALPGVTIEAVHVPTGTRYGTVSGGNGRYLIPNVRVGGPYTVTANLSGFRPAEVTGVSVPLGGTTNVAIKLQLEAVSEAITVTADVDPIINPNRTGATSAVSEEQIESLPTVNRSLQDFARTNPYFNVDPIDATSTRMTVAGKNNRYNTVQIDGAVNNDLFGLADTGTPGGQADLQPIAIDAIQELQLVVSPYDVRQGGFTGGGVNAITRSGTNDFHGSVFYTKRDSSYVGDGPNEVEVDEFDFEQYGGRLGGPILRDRLFFFVTGETTKRQEPTGVSAEAGSPSVSATIAGLAAQAAAIAKSKYGYDPGSLGDFPEARDGDNLFGRLDWNIGSSHQLTLRHNYVEGARDVVSDRFFTRFRFESSTYAFASETNSTVAQLNSTFGANSYNEARVGLQTIKEQRAVPTVFPSIEIGGAPRAAQIILGTERFSGANALDQDILEVTDDFTWLRGNHTITVGTHNEFFEFKNLFMSDAYGYYFFPTIADFEAGRPREYSITFATGSNPRRPTQFEVAQYGIYVSDQWRVNDAVALTMGVRADMPRFADTPSHNPAVLAAIGFDTAETASESAVISPRFGFNWQPGGTGTQQVRGGIGVFTGRTPYVWISNAYGNTGVEQVALSCSGLGCTPFVTDPLNQPRDFPPGTGAFSVDLIDPDFQLPRVLRATLGYDRELFAGIRGTAEVVWTKNLEDVYYHNVNKVQTGTSPLDGRPRYGNVSTSMRDAILLTNTDKGEQRILSLQVNKSFSRGFAFSASYANQDAKSGFDGTSSRAISNWQFHHTKGDIFNAEESRSAFEIEHRFTVSTSWNFSTGPVGHTLAFYYNAQSGRPYSLLFGTDINGDGYSTNDLLYVPAAGNVIIQKNAGSTWSASPDQQWLNYLEGAGLDGDCDCILDRYASTEPWSRQLDLHYELGLPVYREFLTNLTFDVLNVFNMFSNDSGVVRFVSNQNFLPVTYQGQDAATGKPIYRERFANALAVGSQFSTADIRSRWQARVGLRVTF